MERPTFEELKTRLKNARMKDGYDDRHACCWQGYLAALMECELITIAEHCHLVDLVPVEDPNPTLVVLLG